MTKKALLITGSSSKLLSCFKFNIFEKEYDLYFLQNSSFKKKENYYSYENLDDLSIKLDIYDAIYLISFGSNTSGRDFIPYINSIKNFENLINLLSRLDKNVFIYHASSISIFNSGQLKLFKNNKIKYNNQSPYVFSKITQNKILKEIGLKNKKFQIRIVHLGWVYKSDTELIKRFLVGSLHFGPIVFSLLYSPLKLIYPTNYLLIYDNLKSFLSPKFQKYNPLSEIILVDKKAPKRLINLFLESKLLFFSPVPFAINIFLKIYLMFLNKKSNLWYVFYQYIEINISKRLDIKNQ
jgi:hypothetical protein